MSDRRDSRSDAVYVIPSGDNGDECNRAGAVHSEDTEAPRSKRTRRSPSSDMGNPFLSTQLCRKLRAGTCPHDADSCSFAHSVEELRRPAVEGRLCNKFRSSEGCPYGESCAFLHDPTSRNRGSFSSGPVDHNWKTRVCNKWANAAFCPFGYNCHFAHGVAELHRIGGGLVTSAPPRTRQTGQADTVTTLASPGVPPQRTLSAVAQKPSGVRAQRKWKGPDKISRIYGDWIDDIE